MAAKCQPPPARLLSRLRVAHHRSLRTFLLSFFFFPTGAFTTYVYLLVYLQPRAYSKSSNRVTTFVRDTIRQTDARRNPSLVDVKFSWKNLRTRSRKRRDEGYVHTCHLSIKSAILVVRSRGLPKSSRARYTFSPWSIFDGKTLSLSLSLLYDRYNTLIVSLLFNRVSFSSE